MCIKDFFGNADTRATQKAGDADDGVGCRSSGPVRSLVQNVRMLQVLQVESVVQGHEVRVTRYPPERHIVLGKQRERVFEGEEKTKIKQSLQ